MCVCVCFNVFSFVFGLFGLFSLVFCFKCVTKVNKVYINSLQLIIICFKRHPSWIEYHKLKWTHKNTLFWNNKIKIIWSAQATSLSLTLHLMGRRSTISLAPIPVLQFLFKPTRCTGYGHPSLARLLVLSYFLWFRFQLQLQSASFKALLCPNWSVTMHWATVSGMRSCACLIVARYNDIYCYVSGVL